MQLGHALCFLQIEISCHETQMLLHLLDSDQTGSVNSSQFIIFIAILKELQRIFEYEPEVAMDMFKDATHISPADLHKPLSSIDSVDSCTESFRLWTMVMKKVTDDSTEEALEVVLQFMGDDSKQIALKMDSLFTFYGDLGIDNTVL